MIYDSISYHHHGVSLARRRGGEMTKRGVIRDKKVALKEWKQSITSEDRLEFLMFDED